MGKDLGLMIGQDGTYICRKKAKGSHLYLPTDKHKTNPVPLGEYFIKKDNAVYWWEFNPHTKLYHASCPI